MSNTSAVAEQFRDLEQAIEGLGLPLDRTVAELAALYRALAKPSQLDLDMRHLQLEWLGAYDLPHPGQIGFSREAMMSVLSRSVGIEAVEAFELQDLQRGMGFPASQLRAFVRDGHLWAYGEASLKFPRWQFVYDRDGFPRGFISDRLRIVVAAIPGDANPGLVRSLMTLSCPALPSIRGREVSPREYLLAGGAPSAVAAVLLRYLEADLEQSCEVANRVSEWA
ncbi:hypothetical protein [Frigoribacterium sp. PhB118]|uniref:hypothetical protein n=1 Tax=Frigoribacterium sp. PhB118 TaxID=2485175 RepID=UPI000F4710F2|nr:hypothetical protein [Frigoribacterium sp. PhB118]